MGFLPLNALTQGLVWVTFWTSRAFRCIIIACVRPSAAVALMGKTPVLRMEYFILPLLTELFALKFHLIDGWTGLSGL